jgi:hypothetical protein
VSVEPLQVGQSVRGRGVLKDSRRSDDLLPVIAPQTRTLMVRAAPLMTLLVLAAACGSSNHQAAPRTDIKDCSTVMRCRELAQLVHRPIETFSDPAPRFTDGIVVADLALHTDGWVADLHYTDEHTTGAPELIRRQVLLRIHWSTPLICPTNRSEQLVQSPSGRSVCYVAGPVGVEARSIRGASLYITSTYVQGGPGGPGDTPVRRWALRLVDSLG